MPQFLNSVLLAALCLMPVPRLFAAPPAGHIDGNRLTYLSSDSPFYPGLGLPKLTTPQWVGEPGVDAVVILAIDDMRQPEKYETVLRPILERLKRIDGRAPVSIMCNQLDPGHTLLTQWLQEGLSLEVHTLTHPCPLLANGNLTAAVENYAGSIALLNRIAGNHPVVFRMPCCDSLNSPSPRFYAELFNRVGADGQFLTLDSSVMNILTSADPALPHELVLDANGQERFQKYIPSKSFVTTIENYPYPYVVGRLCWEFPAMVPSDWEAQHLHGTNNPVTVKDWEAALDATVVKQGTFSFIFHPHGWIRPDQMVAFIDYAVARYGSRVKFLTFHEAAERITRNFLGGQGLRSQSGSDNGVRVLDLNNDGFMDVVIGNEHVQRTRLWSPTKNEWRETSFPTQLAGAQGDGQMGDAGVQFGVMHENGFATMLVNATVKGAWDFDGQQWKENKSLLAGLDINGQPILTSDAGRDRGVRFHDVNHDGRDELIVGNETQSAVFAWATEEECWKPLSYQLPPGTRIVNGAGADAGLRFVDINGDGYDDVLFSDANHYSLHLFVPEQFLGFQAGWSREVSNGPHSEPGAIPMIVRGGARPNNGAWFHSHQLWVQNEDTSGFTNAVGHRSFEELLGGLKPRSQSPEDSLASMRVAPGFRVELVASEPLVKDPIAFEWGADGKLWVVEMGDYPLGLDGRGQPGGVVRFLEDTDGDGRYDKSTVFLDGVNFPTGVMPWGKGVLVSAAPEIFYAEDRDGDGKADVRITLCQGFREGNQQHRLNGFDYGLDNWLYGANGDSGGTIRAVAALVNGTAHPVAESPSLELRGHDFRLRPNHGQLETVSGQTQYGRHRDDWGNWFGNNNPTWLWHVVLPEQYLARNPYLPVRSVKHVLANYPDSTRVYPISRSMQRFNDVAMLNHVTSANSAMPYRDSLFGEDFERSVFISEPVHNTVHREILEENGVSFTSHRAQGEEASEFLAAADNWFRPTMLKTGPDGALYIADMYRFVLEHPEWIPADTQKSLDLRAGCDQGRIYRVYPKNAVLRPIPRLAGLPPAELATFLESPNGWSRDTAQRLLVSARDPSVVPDLARIATQAVSPKARIQALWTLQGMEALDMATVRTALSDPDARAREHAVRLSEPHLRPTSAQMEQHADERQALQEKLLSLVSDPAMRVRFQLAFSLGESANPNAGRALVQLSVRDATDAMMQTAVLSSAVPHVESMLQTLLQSYVQDMPAALLQEVLKLAIALKKDELLVQPVSLIAATPSAELKAWQWQSARALLDAVEARSGSLRNYEKDAPTGPVRRAAEELGHLCGIARSVAQDAASPEDSRVMAVALIGRGPGQPQADLDALANLLRPQSPLPLQRAALDNLGRRHENAVAELFLTQWKSFDPGLRTDVLRALLSRPQWTGKLLDAMEAGAFPVNQLSPSDRQKILSRSEPGIRARAQKLFAIAPDRRQLLKDFRAVLDLPGDRAHGGAIFRANCTPCHRLQNEGNNVGPDLGALGSKSPLTLLTAILDPNQAVETRYISYTAVTSSDREISGIIVAETPSSVTLRSAGGQEETLLRSELTDLSSSGMSLMPEGLEKVMSRSDLADLLAFLTAF